MLTDPRRRLRSLRGPPMTDPMLAGLVVIALSLGLIALGLSVALSLMLAGLAGFLVFRGSVDLASYVFFESTNIFALTAVPLFILLGEVLLRCGVSDTIYRGTSRLFAWAGRAAALEHRQLRALRRDLRLEPGDGRDGRDGGHPGTGEARLRHADDAGVARRRRDAGHPDPAQHQLDHLRHAGERVGGPPVHGRRAAGHHPDGTVHDLDRPGGARPAVAGAPGATGSA